MNFDTFPSQTTPLFPIFALPCSPILPFPSFSSPVLIRPQPSPHPACPVLFCTIPAPISSPSAPFPPWTCRRGNRSPKPSGLSGREICSAPRMSSCLGENLVWNKFGGVWGSAGAEVWGEGNNSTAGSGFNEPGIKSSLENKSSLIRSCC